MNEELEPEELDEDSLPEEGEELPESTDEELTDSSSDEASDEQDDDSALEPDTDIYAEVEYEKDGELYRYEVPKDVADAIRAAERERLGARPGREQVSPAVAKSELANAVMTWLNQGHSDGEITEALVKLYYAEQNSPKAAKEKDEPLPENATIEEEIEYRINKSLKPLQQKVQQYENLLRRQEEQQRREMTWVKNDSLFEAELRARGLPLTMNNQSAQVMRSVIAEMYPNVRLDEYQLTKRQVRAILDQFAEEMTQEVEYDDDEPYQYSRARVVYGGRQERQRTGGQPRKPAPQQRTPPKQAPKIMSGRTARGTSHQSSEAQKPKTPRDVTELLRSI